MHLDIVGRPNINEDKFTLILVWLSECLVRRPGPRRNVGLQVCRQKCYGVDTLSISHVQIHHLKIEPSIWKVYFDTVLCPALLATITLD